MLRRRVAYLRRMVATPETPEDVEAILLSHGHQDHLDLRPLPQPARSARVLVAPGLGTPAARNGFASGEGVEAGEGREIGGVTVRATVAIHGGGRPPLRRH